MKSQTLPSFWEKYERLDESKKKQARKAFALWAENPFHPSLYFKCINPQGNVWAVRISRGYRAVGTFENDTVVRFWVGGHKELDFHVPILDWEETLFGQPGVNPASPNFLLGTSRKGFVVATSVAF